MVTSSTNERRAVTRGAALREERGGHRGTGEHKKERKLHTQHKHHRYLLRYGRILRLSRFGLRRVLQAVATVIAVARLAVASAAAVVAAVMVAVLVAVAAAAVAVAVALVIALTVVAALCPTSWP